MKRIKNFVKNTFKDIPKEDREALIKSVTVSLIEKVEDLVDGGMDEQSAIDKTVLEFGNIEDYVENRSEITIVKKISKSLRHYRNDLIFSISGAVIIIGMLVFTNLYYAPGIIWFVIPALAVLWWPLAILYRLLNKKENRREEKDE